jgi:radical SAM protein with 4Fe4S-binding SPASM domain
MAQRSAYPTVEFYKRVFGVLRQRPAWGKSILKLQLNKAVFPVRHPFGATHGKPDGLRYIGMRITDVCNLRCHSCGQWGDHGYLRDADIRELYKRDLPIETYRKFIDDVLSGGHDPIWYVWGGEPFMYRQIRELLAAFRERNQPLILVSNGTGVARLAEEIVASTLVFHLSLESADAETHNQQRPGPTPGFDNFAAIKESLEAISEEKKRRGTDLPVLMPITCITRYNVDHLLDLHEFTSRYCDGHIFYATWWIDEQSARDHTADFSRRFGFEPSTHLGWIGDWKDFDHGHCAAVIAKLRARAGKNGLSPVAFLPNLPDEDFPLYYRDHTEKFGYDQCISIFSTMEINNNGDVSLCRDYNDYVIGNIASQSLDEIWEGEPARKFRQSIATDGLMPVCRRCCGLMGF